MAIIVPPRNREALAAEVLTQLQVEKDRREGAELAKSSDPVKWISENFYLGATGNLVELAPHQKCVLRLMFQRDPRTGRLPYRAIVYSAIKKSGKSAIAGMVARWFAETQVRFAEIMCIGNDLTQAKERSFREIRESIQVNPGYNRNRSVLPGRWNLRNQLDIECMTTGTHIKAIAVDAKGEAGGKQAVTIWTELWGAEHTEAKRFWDEMTPIPTIPDSFRLVETYAGYDGESTLLYDLYEKGMEGKQCTAHDLAWAGKSDAPGESYEELLHAFKETDGNPEVLVPVWINEVASLFMYWDSGLNARRMPWQVGEMGEEYYRGEESILPTNAFRRLHFNEWVGAESSFVPIEQWDKLREDLPPFLPGDKTPVVIGVDAATTGDCFAVVAVTRHPDKKRHMDIAVRAVKIFDPKESGGRIDYDAPNAFVRKICEEYNVVKICFDPYQLESLSQEWRKDGIAWVEPFTQMGMRLAADRQLYDLIMNAQLCHTGNEGLRQHILNANVKLEADSDSKMRIIKKSGNRKIDATIALSMAAHQCRYLLL